ncbi:PPOX class F420-dependent oxidoreductase [Nocardia bhagyanarayanae]|uniref:Pyridoxamine 5'-phosphate oxidase family protein n=1 Tax=Nocardia bhagyanarayanae TaxID=1215925 RepID=A0A543FD14_9NOCA|nr:PPOX class F420-dependent oxidoreductase [Nocardia bhagyanarayanae]TQM31717.1 pyridoxamine 5'-phosphate oxidase family protein [Nocardia bhagyanarayanae]
MVFTQAEIEFLEQQPIGRFGTVGPNDDPQIRPVGVHLAEDRRTVDVVGHALAATQKWRNVLRNPRVAFLVDSVESVDPPVARGIEIRGVAEPLRDAVDSSGGLSGEVIRIHPRRIISWGLDSPRPVGRDV